MPLLTGKGAINCQDKYGTFNDFSYDLVITPGVSAKFRVFPLGNLKYPEWLEFNITYLKQVLKQGKVTMMFNHGGQVYSAKGIPDAMIEEAAMVLNLKIISSSQLFPILTDESRGLDSTKVWNRLVSAGKAIYDSTKDIYTFI